MPFLTYGPPNVRLIRPKHLPQAAREAGVAFVERKLSNSTVKDLVSISGADWHIACRRFNATQQLAKQPGRLQARVASIARMFGVTDRTPTNNRQLSRAIDFKVPTIIRGAVPNCLQDRSSSRTRSEDARREISHLH